MMASKYLPQLIAISICYYWMFQALPETRWRLGKKRFLTLVLIMVGAVSSAQSDRFPASHLARNGNLRGPEKDWARWLRIHGQTLQPSND